MAMHIAKDPPPVSPVRPAANTRPTPEQEPQQAKASQRLAQDDASQRTSAKAEETPPELPKPPEEPRDDPQQGSPAANSAMAQLSKALERGDLDAVEQAFQALRLRRSSAGLADPLINLVA